MNEEERKIVAWSMEWEGYISLNYSCNRRIDHSDLCASCYELNRKGREKLIEEVETCKV